MKKIIAILYSIALSHNVLSIDVIWQKTIITGNNVEQLSSTKITKDNNNKVYYIGKSGSVGKIFSIDVSNTTAPVSVCISDLFGSNFQFAALNSDICYISGHILYKGNDGYLWDLWLNGTTWQNAKVNTVTKVLDTGISFDEYNRLYYIGIDQKVYQASLSGNTWASSSMPVAALAQVKSDLLYSSGHIFYVGTDNKIYNYYWTGTSWQNTVLNSSAPILASGSELSIDEYGRLYCTGNDSKLYQYTYSPATSWVFILLNNSLADAFCSPKFQINNGRIFYKKKNSNLISFLHWNNGWNDYSIVTTGSTNPVSLNFTDFIVTNNGDIVYCDATDNKMYILTPKINWTQITIASNLTATKGVYNSSSSYFCDVSVTDETSIIRRKCPIDYQFFCRNASNVGSVPFEGSVLGFNDITLKVDKTAFNGSITTNYYTIALNTLGAFITSLNINAELSEYKFSYRLNGQFQYTQIAEKVVCGDAFIVSGQSNASATTVVNTTYNATTIYGKYGRSYGNSEYYWCNNWNYPNNNPIDDCSSRLGALALPLQNLIIKNYSIPTCFINSALGGTSIDDHLLNPTKNQFYFEYYLCDNLGIPSWKFKSITGHLLRRVYEAGLENGIKGFIWYQGEGDVRAFGTTPTYTQKFQTLYNSIKTYIPSIEKTFVVQIHSSPVVDPNQSAVQLRGFGEEQRKLPSIIQNLKIISSNGVKYPNCDGVHFDENGYSEIATRLYDVIKMDLYGAPFDVGKTAPDIVTAQVNSSTKLVTLEFNQVISTTESDPLTNIVNAIHLNNSAVISSPSISNKILSFYVSNTTGLTKLSYLGFLPCNSNVISPGCVGTNPTNDSFNWWCPSYIKNANKIASLTFTVPITSYYRISNTNVTDDKPEIETNTLEVNLHPNPSSDIVTVNANEKIKQVVIMDITGKIICFYDSVEFKEFTFRIDNYNKGIYFIKIITKDKTIFKKLNVQ